MTEHKSPVTQDYSVKIIDQDPKKTIAVINVVIDISNRETVKLFTKSLLELADKCKAEPKPAGEVVISVQELKTELTK